MLEYYTDNYLSKNHWAHESSVIQLSNEKLCDEETMIICLVYTKK
jgi:hypothetical protein